MRAPMTTLAAQPDPDSIDRSRRIVEAANDLLEEEGLEGLTIRAVLKRTGLARRAFYERFAGKDELVLAVFARTIRLAADHFREEAAALPHPMARLELIVTSLALGSSDVEQLSRAQNYRRGAAMSREHLRLAEARPAELQAALEPLITLITKQLSDGMAAGMVRQAAPRQLATLVYNLVATTVHTEFLTQEAAVPDRGRRVQLAADVWEFCRRAIAA